VTEWGRVLKRVESIVKDLDEPFFRGHGGAGLPLVSSLGRQKFHPTLENNLYYDFLTYSSTLLPQKCDSWDALFVMRHHGLPTRLLDWTQSFSVAVYFAVARCVDAAAIWILDPFVLNKQTVGEEALWHPQTDFEYGYYDYFIGTPTKRFPGRAIAILPSKTTARVLAQRGVFTIHKIKDEPLDSVCKSGLAKIELPQAALSDAKNFLKLAGVNEFTLFPDLDGLAGWLRSAHDVDVAKPRRPRTRVRRLRSIQ